MSMRVDTADAGYTAEARALLDSFDDTIFVSLGVLFGTALCAQTRVEALTDDLAARPYQSLKPDELDELTAALEPLATLLLAAQD